MLNRLLKSVIRCYQKFISPFLIPSCRFYPSCSEYAAQALERFGFFGALRRIVARLSKCHPYHDGGFDPVK
ncbi:MAG: membrane protein insertion efficiency factor YidD [Nitrospinae bacterium]|nr:membrane protein insertion efficiency factor YidD [Nitrospinota bacterium]